MICAKHLVKRYGDKIAVNNVSFTIGEGEIVGFLGPNGAGKTTIMNMMTGYISSTRGEVFVCDNEILKNPSEAKSHIGYLPELPPLYMDMTVMEYLSFVYDLKKVKKDSKDAHINEILELIKIDDVKGRLIKHLSKGYKQRVGIAQALLGDPDILILDEPTVGLDPGQINDMRQIIKKLGEKMTIILSSHILSEIRAVCQRVIIINGGRKIADGSIDQVINNTTSKNIVEFYACDNEEAIRNIFSEYEVDHQLEIKPVGGECECRLITDKDIDVRREIFMMFAAKGIPIIKMNLIKENLEDAFLKLVNKEENQNDSNTKA